MCDALVRHGSEYTIVRWIGATLEGHIVVATLNRTSVRLVIARGCPWGGAIAASLVSGGKLFT